MDFRILGPLEAVDDSGHVELARGKQRALLALLLLHADRVVPVDRLVDDLWGEAVPESAPKMVQILVSRLRKQLPQGLIETGSSGYRLDLDGHSLDLRSFERLHADGREALADGRANEAAGTLRRALALWRGAPLAEFEEPFARLEQPRLVEQQLTCFEDCVEAELALGRHTELVAEIDALVRRRPLRERLQGQLMLALYRSGRHAEALEAFRTFRGRLRDELGIDPPARLKELERLVLRQDPSLELAPGAEATALDLQRPAAVSAPPPAGGLAFRILGPLELRVGERLVSLGGIRRRSVLALLLLEANRVVPVDRLVDGVWGDEPPASAHASLQNHLFRLRRELGDRLVRRPPGYLLRVAPGELDLERFRALVAEARGAEPAVAAERLRDALALWRGAPLADLAAEPAGRAAGHLDELRLAALEDRIDADLALGRHVQLVPELEELVAREPHRERLRRQLIVALYRSGRQADALDAYAAARRTLVEELGTEPGRELQDVQRAVLRQDPALEAPADAPAAPARPPLPEARKTVTVLVADVAADDAPADPEARRAATLERVRAVEAALDRHGASATSLGGGRVLGVFGVPAAQDDDSLRAVTAAVSLRSSSLAGRVGLATGEVVTGDPLVSGAPVDEAARLQERAAAGEVLAAARTWRSVRHAAAASARDGAWAIETVDAAAEPLLRRLETPLVGRERELREIVESFERAAAEGRPHLVTVFGAPGLGKTRLAVECVERLRGLATAAVGRCRAGAREASYAPLREVLTALAEGDPAAWVRERLGAEAGAQPAEQLAAAVGLAAGSAHTEDAALAARRLLSGLARERPLLLVLEDIQWAAPAFLDFVESVVELARAPVLTLCLARPDLLDLRPYWGGGRVSSSAVLLDALGAAESEALLDRLCPDGELDAAARTRILAVAEGNPLFIEQLLAVALEGDPEALPDSIQTLLAARLDRLDAADRAVVEAAAVCGPSFTTEDVESLVDGDATASLVTLVRRELVRPGELGEPGREGWSFRHGLIRDVAYGSIPKRRRAELHERLAARALEHRTDGDARAGLHLDAAVRARLETGEDGAAVGRLASRAASHLVRAGLAALERDDPAVAAALLGRANELLPREAPERVELLPKLGEALSWVGESEAAGRVLAEAQAVAAELGDARLVARASIARYGLFWADPALAPEEVLRDIDEAMPVLERAGDHETLAMAEVARFHARDRGRLPDPEERLSIALDHARKAGARQMEHHVMGWICITMPRGTLPVDEAIARVEEIAEASTSGYVRASALGALGLLRAARGEFEAARELVEQDRLLLEELGLRQPVAAHAIAIGEVELLAGDEAAAERVFREGFDATTSLRDSSSAANAAWRLGLVLARRGRDDEAERFARIAERTEAPAMWIDVWWRVVLALVAAHRGDAAQAERLVGEARDRMAGAPESGMHADALLESAEALRSAGDAAGADSLLAEAAGIAERLGYVVALRRAREAQRAATA